jgi:hypothetical protein
VTTSSGVGHLYSYSIATGERRTLDSGQLTAPFTIGGGVYWDTDQSVVTHIAGVLPPSYVVQPKPSSNPTIAVDRAQVAWVRGGVYDSQAKYIDPEIVVREDSGPSVSVFRSKAGVMPQVVALVGPYLVWQNSVVNNQELTVLDLRTGATAALRGGAGGAYLPAGTPTGRHLVLGVRDGLFTPPTVVDTTRAPRLHC